MWVWLFERVHGLLWGMRLRLYGKLRRELWEQLHRQMCEQLRCVMCWRLFERVHHGLWILCGRVQFRMRWVL